MATGTEEFPNRQWEFIITSIFMLVMSTFFTIWRVVIRFRASPWMDWSDWLMVLGTAMNVSAISVAIACGFAGAGRLLRDPFWTIERMIHQNHLTFTTQLLNVYGMYVVKLSVCAYLLALNFSKRYRWVVWGTVAFVTIFNFVLPATQHFGLCRPLASRWDNRIKDKQCWSQNVRIGIAYTQAISNIVTDLIYATAPIAYLRSVQLSRRTQWSVRVVFLMSLVCTAISSIKLVYFQKLQGQIEVYYESVSLSIWSITEISVGIVVANLPPLRKSFDSLFKHLLPESVTENISSGRKLHGGNHSFNLSTYRNQATRRSTIGVVTGRSVRHTEDNASDKAILGILEGEDIVDNNFSNAGITRTTRVTVNHTTGDY
ncbi:hypothetical protein EKO04_008770 [Ascochyta lentis]|uniref:Rhodopsin domain-containing protein n=1 Tax=Ascochyta lentis TaxID=205686 RepID=A0A8H7MHC1_9PLEO|nr:hypothetical protein EKO04_008770 [Ascochyta lentis]